jgi:hypothetical protein
MMTIIEVHMRNEDVRKSVVLEHVMDIIYHQNLIVQKVEFVDHVQKWMQNVCHEIQNGSPLPVMRLIDGIQIEQEVVSKILQSQKIQNVHEMSHERIQDHDQHHQVRIRIGSMYQIQVQH